MKPKINKCLLISLIIGACYALYSASYWTGANSGNSDVATQLGAGIATALVTPHLVCTGLAVIFNALSVFMRSRGFALTCAILYTVALVTFPMYFMFVIIEMILSYIGFATMKKQ